MSLRNFNTIESMIAGVISTIGFKPSKHHPMDCVPTAKIILALPAGTVAVRECDCWFVQGKRYDSSCVKCHGTGRIERDMSIQEVVEWAKRVIKGRMDNGIDTVLLSGELVEVKK